MPYQVVRFQDTPNPNALKCVLDHSPGPTPRSYFNPPQASPDPLAAALFAIPGVTNVLINDGWLTVSKSPDSDWKTIKPAVVRALSTAP